MRFLGRGLIGLLLFSLALGLLGFAGNTIKIAVQDRVNKEPRAQNCLLYTSPSPRDLSTSRMPSSA